jgi:hypothetical protein
VPPNKSRKTRGRRQRLARRSSLASVAARAKALTPPEALLELAATYEMIAALLRKEILERPVCALSAAPVSFERRLAGPPGSSDTLLKRLQMRNGGILGGPGAHDPDVAIRIIDCLNPIDPMSRDNAISVHPCSMIITSQRTQLNQRLTRPMAERGAPKSCAAQVRKGRAGWSARPPSLGK